MMSLEEIREIEPALKEKSDEEVKEIRFLLYQLAQLTLECYFKEKTGSDIQVSIPDITEKLDV
jgi:hypothetical protein